MSRKRQYNLLSDIARSLLNEIYQNEEGFITARYIVGDPTTGAFVVKSGVHPLEPYIISYDENMENQGIVINIGRRAGFNIRYDDTDAYSPAEQFFDRCSYTIRNNSAEQIQKIVNAKELEFKAILESKGFQIDINNETFAELYYDRLNIDSNKYLPSLIEGYLHEDDIEEPIDELSYYSEDIVSNVAEVVPA